MLNLILPKFEKCATIWLSNNTGGISMAASARYSKKNRLDDFDYFVKNYKKIYKKYGHSFIAIKNGNVIGAYSNVEEALANTKEPVGTYILQECNGQESGYTSYISSFNLFKV